MLTETSTIFPSVGSLLAGRYEVVREIGRGGCAVVVEAVDHRRARMVAIKLPTPGGGASSKFVSRFARESRVIASIQHPNVCAARGSGVLEDGTPFLVMERLFGESLRWSLAQHGPPSVGEAMGIVIQLLSALGAVHAKGIVHRDVKPDNIVLIRRGPGEPLVKLLDFGLCRPAASRRPEEETMTCEGQIVGTPEYMAPEQVLGSVSLDFRVDLYAAGVVLYEALTGDRAFFSPSVREILHRVINKKLPPLRQLRPDAPAELEEVVSRAMHREPARRYQTVAAFQADLVAIKYGLGEHVVQEEETTAAWNAPTRPFARFRRPVRSEWPSSTTVWQPPACR
jgi:serine/threonine-protein kinase